MTGLLCSRETVTTRRCDVKKRQVAADSYVACRRRSSRTLVSSSAGKRADVIRVGVQVEEGKVLGGGGGGELNPGN
jgi:hypothetical protein